MDIDNQKDYWDSVAQQKTFTHPISINLLLQYAGKNAAIIDYGCGYGRIVKELLESGFLNAAGYDTSIGFIKRGKNIHLPIHHIPAPSHLPLEDDSIDCFLLFAVLTCIPSNPGQSGLIELLRSKLKPGGFIYVSDYFLQENEVSKSRYIYFNNDRENYGVFSLPEGATLRHHTKEWIATLFRDFTIKTENIIELKTMNGNSAEAFQMIVQK
ncbi:MAG: methyltransferase domain-containing protein [Ferruginibacter sp.]